MLFACLRLFSSFFHDDILLLSLVAAGTEGDSASVDSGTTACLGIFDKEPRGSSAHGAAGPTGGNRSSLRVCAG